MKSLFFFKRFFSFCLMMNFFIVLSQDVHFSQMSSAPLTLNPALAGANYSNQASLIYRDQWKGADAQFKTIYAGYDMRLKEKNEKGYFGVGLNFYSDKAGDAAMTTNYAGLSLAYHVRINKFQTLGLAAQPSFGQRSLDYSTLRWGMQYDGNGYNSALVSGEPLNAPNQISFFDINAGVVYTYRSSEHYMTANDQRAINVGYSINHINQPKYSFYKQENERLYMKHVFFANALIGISNSKLSLMPAFYGMIQGAQKEFLAGTYFRYSMQDKSVYTGIKKGAAFSLGTFYRLGDAFIAKGMVEWSNWSMGFAYDLNVSSYTAATGGRGGFELVLRFVSPNPFGNGGAKSRI
jgi:type IX secretion system PorP/SprF family membrane protein